MYIDVNVIQSLPPSCVNRDDTGSPKTAYYGGVRRARVSSQSWKKAVRENPDLVPGVNMVNGDITLKPVADCWGFDYKELVLD